MYEPSPIEIVAPAPRKRFASTAETLAYYQAVGVKTREDVLILAELALVELQKVNAILDEVFERCAEAKAAEEAAQAAQLEG